MSLTTRCPACATTFRVVPDQLKLSDGWVRCGHCADVFDATRYLETWAPPRPEAANLADSAKVSLPQGHQGSPKGGDERAATPGGSGALEPASAAAWPTPPAVPADMGMGDMPLVNQPNDLPENRSNEPAEPKVQTAEAFFEPVPETDPQVQADPFAVDAAFAPTDVSPLYPVPSGEHALPPAQDDRDDLDRLLDQALDESVTPEPEPADSGQVSSPASPERTVDAATVAREPGFSSEPEHVDGADFQADLQRYAASLKKPELPKDASPESVEPERSTRRKPEPVRFADDDDDLDDGEGLPASNEPEFVRQARQRAFWQSPVMRGLLLILALLLSVLLAGQWTLHERDRLAAAQPELAPWLTRFCEPLGCEVQPMRDINAIVIDSSTLVRRLGNFYSFDLVLKNTSSVDLAVPALELSLTDTGDTVISRRVFLPEELPGVPPMLPAQGSVPVSLRLSLSVGDQLPMAGYRALVFYP